MKYETKFKLKDVVRVTNLDIAFLITDIKITFMGVYYTGENMKSWQEENRLRLVH